MLSFMVSIQGDPMSQRLSHRDLVTLLLQLSDERSGSAPEDVAHEDTISTEEF
jgi:hypothetical protein